MRWINQASQMMMKKTTRVLAAIKVSTHSLVWIAQTLQYLNNWKIWGDFNLTISPYLSFLPIFAYFWGSLSAIWLGSDLNLNFENISIEFLTDVIEQEVPDSVEEILKKAWMEQNLKANIEKYQRKTRLFLWLKQVGMLTIVFEVLLLWLLLR